MAGRGCVHERGGGAIVRSDQWQAGGVFMSYSEVCQMAGRGCVHERGGGAIVRSDQWQAGGVFMNSFKNKHCVWCLQ